MANGAGLGAAFQTLGAGIQSGSSKLIELKRLLDAQAQQTQANQRLAGLLGEQGGQLPPTAGIGTGEGGMAGQAMMGLDSPLAQPAEPLSFNEALVKTVGETGIVPGAAKALAPEKFDPRVLIQEMKGEQLDKRIASTEKLAKELEEFKIQFLGKEIAGQITKEKMKIDAQKKIARMKALVEQKIKEFGSFSSASANNTKLQLAATLGKINEMQKLAKRATSRDELEGLNNAIFRQIGALETIAQGAAPSGQRKKVGDLIEVTLPKAGSAQSGTVSTTKPVATFTLDELNEALGIEE